jgi:alpha-1,3-glucosyltransferase
MIFYSPNKTSWQSQTIHHAETLYLAGFLLLHLTTSTILPLVATESTRAKWQFLPLMMTSVYCSFGLIWGWARLVWASWEGVKGYVRDDKVKAL